MQKRITSIEKKYQLLQQSWLTQKDVMDLCECGNVNAAKIRQEIEASIAPNTLPEKIPTRLVVEHKSIDLEYIVRMYQLTKGGAKQ